MKIINLSVNKKKGMKMILKAAHRFLKCTCSKYTILISFIFVIYLISLSNCEDLNPYKVLGVPRNADDKQIKNAYRKLAKDWHPDKNKSPGAHEKFMKITQAYEILSDQERRSLYDDYGTTAEPRQGGSGGGYHRQSYDDFFRDFDGFEGFFGRGGGGGFRFNFNNGREHARKSQEEEITKKIYDENVFPNSNSKPFIIYSYTEYCFACMSVENVWQSFKQEIKNIGFGAGHSDASWNRELSKNLGINTVPSITGIVNGRIHHFRGEISLKNLREFARRLIPAKLTTELNLNNFNDTLHQSIADNKVFSVFVSSSNQVSLRYQMPCFQFSNYIKCGFIKLDSADDNFKSYLKKNFKIELGSGSIREEHLYLFKENMLLAPSVEFNYRPTQVIKMNKIEYANIQQLFEQNKFLNLPRLSSSIHFYDLCPSVSQFEVDPSNSKTVLCIIIPANKEKSTPNFLFDANSKVRFLRKLNSDAYLKQNAQFTYLYYDYQSDFMDKITKSSKMLKKDNNKSAIENKIIVLRKTDDKYATYDWIEIDDIEDKEFTFLDRIKSNLRYYVNGDKKLQYKLVIPRFYDESSQSFINIIIEYTEEIWNYITDFFFWERIFGNSSFVMLVVCTFLFIWLMMMFSSEKSDPNSVSNNRNRANSSSIYRNRSQTSPTNQNYERNESFSSPNSSFENDYNINTKNQFEAVELNKFNHTELIVDPPRGIRTILLIVNKENSNIIDLFTRVCSNYANKAYQLRFVFLNKNSTSGQKWINELINDTELSDITDSESYSNNSDEEEYDIYNPNEDDDPSHVKPRSNRSSKRKDDFDGDCAVLAVNSKRKYYYVFNFKYSAKKRRSLSNSSSMMEDSLGLNQDAFELRLFKELRNWLDRFIDGFDLGKRKVEQWPRFV